ncbi:hypothetical protein A2331_01670 [Candidatus Falkowbacteria bacterium RIFOXYB2_FULL_34_18]|uniref:Fibronectin type-III domain-containing protein n=1 Tax=Candidatus Falkowbacteria bacterium RIFOXYD2_FULL_34_120 TaxID=1798007 RepID=A0A1F5TQ96_9BACT|nr:MAG: hypothetical protein A2331_01670 [Candidatus Falkowbacteria bacterium RIFOXYB2_FULL_34_18]OGF29320.1 MAG: hypothetical protein A2500_05550 [Candidatus Falkowbacteria bacterium RIFOXYC12_FULL_34_55]OGF36436.1 MAG: hypothetical protein A2466_01210 [Candidatus Falkowbacteria bacterium RIFOXYC2_FULL_34_220]OGF38915.1 MAG: hypothetical protein A2515_05970 [Candidatus Falkowbacteria bacterium RIFOXYD12_FULL_34_57]OGF40934.1 MAG: hypothetical protein A2531_04195 [Candidatus Falkowbacteria bact
MNKKNVKKIITIIFFGFLVFLFVYSNQKTREQEIINQDSRYDLSVCTNDLVDQVECYSSGFPTPKFRWSCNANQEIFEDEYVFVLQIDDNNDFLSPEFNSGEVSTKNLFYEIDREGLQSEVLYYWRIKVQNKYATWSDWAPSDIPFTTSPMCK